MGSSCAKEVGQGQHCTLVLCWRWGTLEESAQTLPDKGLNQFMRLHLHLHHPPPKCTGP